jgi:hypothetical protein
MRRDRIRIKALQLFACAFLLAGCATQPHDDLPRYTWTDDQAALRELSRRAHSVQSVSAAALLTLTRPDGQSVRLDGAVVISLSGRSVRLRAWKLSQAVFDLTLTPQGLWVEIPKDAARRQQIAPASMSASQLAHALSIFGGQVFDGPGVRIIDSGGAQFQVRQLLDDGRTMTAQVDRATLLVNQYRLADAAGVVHFTLSLRDYRTFGGILWPTRLSARSDTGTIDAELRDVELNGDLPPTAFVPPRGAEKAS